MVTRTIPEHPGVGRLGRHVEHDPRSLDYAFKEKAIDLHEVLWRRYGKPFDQGQLGSCTGNALAGALNTKPVRNPYKKLKTEQDAIALYSAATVIDGIPGEYPPDDTGSSGLAVCKVAKANGLIRSYKHAFSITAALQALMKGPVITGVPWYESFDTPDEHGNVQIAGQIRGGHEFEVLGYDPATDLVTAENSWGPNWGVNGRFHFTSGTWARLLSQQGDVTIPIN